MKMGPGLSLVVFLIVIFKFYHLLFYGYSTNKDTNSGMSGNANRRNETM